jgi:hypothetical protein
VLIYKIYLLARSTRLVGENLSSSETNLGAWEAPPYEEALKDAITATLSTGLTSFRLTLYVYNIIDLELEVVEKRRYELYIC